MSARKHRPVLFVSLLVAGLFLASPTGAAAAEIELANKRAVELKNGINHVDLDGDGTMDMVVRARRRALGVGHYTDYLSFLVMAEVYEGLPEWQQVGFDRLGREQFTDIFWTSGEGECTRRDLRLFLDEESETLMDRVTLLVAEREEGEHLCDEQKVHFYFYELANIGKFLGTRQYEFELKREKTSENVYADVGIALREELKINGFD